jgi:hypothetical protein
MDEKNEIITATISLTKEEWESIICDVMNEACFAEVGLSLHIGADGVNRIISNALKVANKINDTTGINVDLSEWKSIYEEKI